MANDVKVLKLITGEEVIARVEQDGDTLILNTPRQLLTRQITTGKTESVLLPWIYSGKMEKVKLSLSQVLVQDDIKDQFEKNYLASVTGLTL